MALLIHNYFQHKSITFSRKKKIKTFQVEKNISHKEHAGRVGVNISTSNLYLELFGQI